MSSCAAQSTSLTRSRSTSRSASRNFSRPIGALDQDTAITVKARASTCREMGHTAALAVMRNNVEAQLLLEEKADLTVAPDGRSLLDLAAKPGHEQIARLLREHMGSKVEPMPGSIPSASRSFSTGRVGITPSTAKVITECAMSRRSACSHTIQKSRATASIPRSCAERFARSNASSRNAPPRGRTRRRAALDADPVSQLRAFFASAHD